MSLKRILISMLAGVGLGAGQTASAATNQKEIRQNVAANTQKNAIEADEAGRIGGSLAAILRRPSHTPYEWGTSRACAKMVRQRRMNRMGISASKI